MGYMGLGMQSWIYKRRPRKPFSKGRVPSFTAVPNYDRKFKLQPSKKTDNFFVYISLGLLTIFITILVLKKDDFINHSNKVNQELSLRISEEEKFSYNFLMNSGINRLKSGNYKGAYSEFNLAHNIKPKNIQINTLLIETLTALCSEDVEYCDKLDVFLLKVNSN